MIGAARQNPKILAPVRAALAIGYRISSNALGEATVRAKAVSPLRSATAVHKTTRRPPLYAGFVATVLIEQL